MPLILGAQSATASGDVITNSCRFNNGDSPYFASDFAGTGSSSAAIATYSFWLKLGLEDTRATLISGKDDTSNYMKVRFADDGSGHYFAVYGISPACDLKSTKIFKDPAAWYNVVMAFDTAQAVSTNRIKVWINGEQITSWSTGTFIAQNEELFLTKSDDLEIGAYNNTEHFDGYMAEVVCIDGTALDETSFGEFDGDTPTVWKPKDVSGLSVGTKGYRLNFGDSAALGDDVSGNNNDFTETNIVAADQGTDSPSNNFCVLNPLDNYYPASTLSEGNLKVSTNAANKTFNTSTFAVTKGKWYWEAKITTTASDSAEVGIASVPSTQSAGGGGELNDSAGNYEYRSDGTKGNNNSNTSYGDTWNTDDDIVGVALDLDNLKLYFSKNGVWQDSSDPESGATGTGAAFTVTAPASQTLASSINAYTPALGEEGAQTDVFELNFGSPIVAPSSGNADGDGYGDFEYAVPSGYYALCTKNLAEYG